jgi:hypothetical protein
MSAALVLAAVAVLAAPGPTPPRTVLSVSPAHVALDAGGQALVRIETGAGRPLRLRATVAGLALDLRGKPRIAEMRDAAAWLSVTPETVDVTRAGATLVIASSRRSSARAGDHSALVLLTATAPTTNGVAIQLRVGVVVTVRVNGPRVHRIEVTRARVKGNPPARTRLIELTFANRGNVIESIDGRRLRITLLHRGRVIAHLPVGQRKVLPRTAALVVLRYRGRRHGAATIRVALAGPGGRTAVRSFPLRL